MNASSPLRCLQAMMAGFMSTNPNGIVVLNRIDKVRG
jgi:hypothetical protein